MFSLYIRELKTFLSSVLGYLFIIVFLIITGLFLWFFSTPNNILLSGLADISGLFNLAGFLFLFLIPSITMRSFAEEKRLGTMELLLTKPLSETQIIIAKYAACLTLLILSLIPTLIYVISVYNLGNPLGNIDLARTFGSYLGLIFLGSAFISIGMLISSFTNNQIIAFILTAPLCFIAFFGFDFIYDLDIFGSLGYYIRTLGLNYHYISISKGVVESRDLVYFIIYTILFLSLTKFSLLSRKW